MDKRVAELINDQINKEFYSAYLYLDFSNYYKDEGLDGFSNWYNVQAQEERDHAMLFLKYLQKNHHKIYLLAASQEELVKAEEALARYNQGIRVVGDAVIHLEDGELTDADRIHGIVNAVNGSEADCILSVLPSPAQEDFIEQNRALIDTRVWIGCGSVLMRSFDDRKMTSRIKRMLVKKVFRYKVEKQN